MSQRDGESFNPFISTACVNKGSVSLSTGFNGSIKLQMLYWDVGEYPHPYHSNLPTVSLPVAMYKAFVVKDEGSARVRESAGLFQTAFSPTVSPQSWSQAAGGETSLKHD